MSMSTENNLVGNVSVYRCPTCDRDALGGEIGDPFIKALHQNNVFQWENEKLNFLVNGTKYSLRGAGDHRVYFDNNGVRIERVSPEEHSSASVAHKCDRGMDADRPIDVEWRK